MQDQHGKQRRIVVFSADAMVWEDVEHLMAQPGMAELFGQGAVVKRVKTIYPSVTYPCHTSMSTGAYPDKHGVVNNGEFHPGRLDLPWNWFASAIRCPDIFTAAKEKGLTTAAVFWPVTGCHPAVDYLVAEYWPQGPEDTKEACYRRAGTSEELYRRAVAPYMEGLTIRTHPDTDRFLVNCCCDILREYRPHLLMIHTGDIDHYRHATGVFSDQVKKGVEDTAAWLLQLVEAAKEAGTFEDTDFFLVSDHGQMGIVRAVRPNVLFAEQGLIQVDGQGHLTDWTAYCHSAGMSAQVHLKDPTDRAAYEKTYRLLQWMRDEGVYGIGQVYTAEEAAREHLSGDFSFVLETDGYTSFAEEWQRPLIQPLDLSDYRFGHATHGYHPDKGPQPTLLAFGPDIRPGAVVERRPIVDEAPTYAQILGVELPWADGSPISEILR